MKTSFLTFFTLLSFHLNAQKLEIVERVKLDFPGGIKTFYPTKDELYFGGYQKSTTTWDSFGMYGVMAKDGIVEVFTDTTDLTRCSAYFSAIEGNKIGILGKSGDQISVAMLDNKEVIFNDKRYDNHIELPGAVFWKNEKLLVFTAKVENQDGFYRRFPAVTIFDKEGKELSEKRFRNNLSREVDAVLPLEAGGYLILGGEEEAEGNPKSNNLYLMKLDEEFNVISDISFLKTNPHKMYPSSLFPLGDDFYAICGSMSKSDGSGNDQWFMKLKLTPTEAQLHGLVTNNLTRDNSVLGAIWYKDHFVTITPAREGYNNIHIVTWDGELVYQADLQTGEERTWLSQIVVWNGHIYVAGSYDVDYAGYPVVYKLDWVK